jgi:cell division protein ZapB
LTNIRLQHYSMRMISEFQLLSEKIDQLAELTQSLRRENADLRLRSTVLTTENADLSNRVQEAYQRVSVLLENIPAAPQEEAAA